MTTVKIERPKAGVVHIVIDRPEKRNALNRATVAGITAAAKALATDETLRVVVLKASGDKAFSAGADLDDLGSLDASNARDFIAGLQGAIGAVRDIPVPVICRIQGTCVGGAMEMAAGCDLRIAVPSATFAMPEVRVGIPSVIEAALLPRLMGRGRAGWLVLSGDVIDAATAERWGFLERVVQPEELDTAVDAAVEAILHSDPAAVRMQKELLRHWDEASLSDAILHSMDVFAKSYATGRPSELMREILAARKR